MYLQSPRPRAHGDLKYWFKPASAQLLLFFPFFPMDRIRVIRDEPQIEVRRSSF